MTSVITEDGELTTIILPGEVITVPGPAGPTITAPGQLTTIFQTLPAETVVIPASTITLPAQTTTIQGAVITLPAVTITAPAVTTQLPPVTQTIVQTLSIPGPTVTQTQTNVQDILVCPQPTPTPGMPSGPQPFNYTWGCPPGLVCSPRKPFACDVFASLPDPSYRCQPSECLPAPKMEPIHWPEGASGAFVQPVEGIFDLNPNYFGLSYEIFGQEVFDVGDGTRVTTGNWESQLTIPTQPARTNVVVPDPRFDIPRGAANQKTKRQASIGDTVPSECYPACDNCAREGQTVGKRSILCEPDSQFISYLQTCQDCSAANGDTQQTNLRKNVTPDLQQWISFCDITRAGETVDPEDGPLPQVSETTVAGSTAIQSQAPPRTVTSQAPTRAAQTSEVVVTSTPSPTTDEIVTSTFIASTSLASRSTTVVTPTPSSLPSSSVIFETSPSETPTPTTSEETTLSTELNAPIGTSTTSTLPQFTTSAPPPTFTGAAHKLGGSAMGLVIALLGAFMALA